MAISFLGGQIIAGKIWASLGIKAGSAATYGVAAAAGALSGYVMTGTLEGTLWGAFSAVTFHGIGQRFGGSLGDGKGVMGSGYSKAELARATAAHGVAGGTLSKLQGGRFGHGLASAGITKVASPAIEIAANDDSFAEATMATIAGGSISSISGGKFANGAVTAAMAYAFNQLSSNLSSEYDAEENSYHDYEFEFELCSTSKSWCDFSNGWDALRRHAYPGQNPNSSVVDTGTYGVRALGVDLGDINVYLEHQTYSIFNVTAENHKMYDGHVQRQLVVREGKMYIRTHGAGNNRGFWLENAGTLKPPVYVPGPAAARLNQHLGRHGFRGLNNSMRAYMRLRQ